MTNSIACQCVREPCDCSVSSSGGGSPGSTTTIGGYTVHSTKAGSCPAVISMLAVAQCRPGCLTDSACPGSQKCCNYGGCPRCQAAATTGQNNGQFYGWHNWINWNGNGNGNGNSGNQVAWSCPVAQSSMFGACVTTCSSDASCAGGGQKCCSNGCGKTCVGPQTTAFAATGSAAAFW